MRVDEPGLHAPAGRAPPSAKTIDGQARLRSRVARWRSWLRRSWLRSAERAPQASGAWSPTPARVLLLVACFGFGGAASAPDATADGSVSDSVRHQLHAAATSAFPDAARIVVTVRNDAGATLASCIAPLTVETRTQRLRGYVAATVRCPVPPSWTAHVAAQINVFYPVVVSRRGIGRGVRITAADVRIAERELSGSGGAYFPKLEQVVGHETRAALAPEQVIAPWHLDRPHLVARGERVALHAGAGGFQVSTSGEALDNGRFGEQIRVRNSNSGKTVYGWVDAPGSVSTQPPSG